MPRGVSWGHTRCWRVGCPPHCFCTCDDAWFAFASTTPPLAIVEFPCEEELLFRCEVVPDVLLHLSHIPFRECWVENVNALVCIRANWVAPPMTSEVDLDCGIRISRIARTITAVLPPEDDRPSNSHDALEDGHFFSNALIISSDFRARIIHEPEPPIPIMVWTMPRSSPCALYTPPPEKPLTARVSR